MLIHIHDSKYAVHLWLENIAIKGKAVANFHGLQKSTAKTEDWVLFVCVVLLQDTTDWLNCMHVLVGLIATHEVQWARIGDFTVWRREVDSNLQTYLTATKDVVEESHTFLHNDFVDGHFHFLVLQLNVHLLQSCDI